jgi:hypothetical protein
LTVIKPLAVSDQLSAISIQLSATKILYLAWRNAVSPKMNEVHQTSDLTRRLVFANFVRHVYQTPATFIWSLIPDP